MNKLISVNEIFGFRIGNRPQISGENGSQLGIVGMINYLSGVGISFDGYEVKTENATYRILIENEQNCCESWGYFSSDDNYEDFIGKDLVDVSLTDTALNQQKVQESGWYDDEGGIQFVDFKFSDGSVLQFAVYNAHNGYYGHSIYVIKDEEILHSDTL